MNYSLDLTGIKYTDKNKDLVSGEAFIVYSRLKRLLTQNTDLELSETPSICEFFRYHQLGHPNEVYNIINANIKHFETSLNIRNNGKYITNQEQFIKTLYQLVKNSSYKVLENKVRKLTK